MPTLEMPRLRGGDRKRAERKREGRVLRARGGTSNGVQCTALIQSPLGGTFPAFSLPCLPARVWLCDGSAPSRFTEPPRLPAPSAGPGPGTFCLITVLLTWLKCPAPDKGSPLAGWLIKCLACAGLSSAYGGVSRKPLITPDASPHPPDHEFSASALPVCGGLGPLMIGTNHLPSGHFSSTLAFLSDVTDARQLRGGSTWAWVKGCEGAPVACAAFTSRVPGQILL